MEEKIIIDVSKHNARVDWQKVKQKTNIAGAIIRCGYGSDYTRQDDEQFKANVEGCIRNNIPFGVYIYSYAKTIEEAKSEAQHTLRLVNPYKGKLSYPIYYDLEQAGTESGAIERANVFGDIIEKAGFWCGVYASEYWWNHYLKGLERFTKWVAKYSANKPNVTNTDIWQYSDKGTVNGLNGPVDMNYVYRDLPSEIKGNKVTTKKVMPTYSVGDKVRVSSYYKTSTDPSERATIKNAVGTITRIKVGARNPYLLNNGDIGWCNYGDIREKL